MSKAYHAQKSLPFCLFVLWGECVDVLYLPAPQYPLMNLHSTEELL